MPAKVFRGMSNDRLYSAGQSALDNRQWDQAVVYFNQVISQNTARVDGALYWKAYALGKLGRRDEANAAIAELRKSYASSRWLDDAKALELELKQASGQKVSPETESDEELKLMAINGLMQSDPERAIPLLESQLKGSASPKVKRNTLFVLAQSNSPKAQALIEQIARGGANPDLQLKAISYMDQRRRPNNNAQVLSEIYTSTTDLAVKRAILQAYAGMRDKDRLLQAAKSEKSPELREFAINNLAGNNGNPELWQLYQAETTTEGKLLLLRYMHSNGNADKLLEVVRNEKDPKVRMDAMRALASQRAGVSGDTHGLPLHRRTGSADQAEHPGWSVRAAQRQGAGGHRPRGEGHQDETADCRTPLQHAVQGSPGLSRGDPEQQMKPLLWPLLGCDGGCSTARGAAQTAGQRQARYAPRGGRPGADLPAAGHRATAAGLDRIQRAVHQGQHGVRLRARWMEPARRDPPGTARSRGDSLPRG